jgi:hypothetical protein
MLAATFYCRAQPLRKLAKKRVRLSTLAFASICHSLITMHPHCCVINWLHCNRLRQFDCRLHQRFRSARCCYSGWVLFVFALTCDMFKFMYSTWNPMLLSLLLSGATYRSQRTLDWSRSGVLRCTGIFGVTHHRHRPCAQSVRVTQLDICPRQDC